MSKYNRLYQDLLQRGFFKDKRDIALSGTCDEYQIFEQRTDDCWVILFINNNLHPFIRVKKDNLLVTMIIPGPHSPKNFNSFLYPLVKELKELEGKLILKFNNVKFLFIYFLNRNYGLLNIITEGVFCIDGRTNEPFILHAHLLTWTGDIPALSKSLNLSGHNSYKACRFCTLEGTCHPSNKHIYYPSSTVHSIRNHEDTVNIGKSIEEETRKDRKDEMIRETGMNFF